jgi:tyrosine-protein kinase Etk/Wzc
MCKDGLQDVIKDTPYENLFVIPAGPVQQNPAELSTLEKTDELLTMLKGKYEFIIIDSSPIGTVSDAFHFATLADTCILIVSKNMTLKYLIENAVKEIKTSDIKSISVVVNDLGSEYKRYGYVGRYGYNYGK